MAYERLVKKMTVENMWIYILSSLKLKQRYGYEIGSYIEKNYGFKPGKVTSYVILYRLVKEGLITLKEEKKDGFGPPRKYYAITDKGLKVLRQGEKFLENMLDRIKKTN